MRALLDLLLPPHCPGCEREGEVLCDACQAPLYRRVEEPAGAPIGLSSSLPHGIVQLEWCAAFSGPVRDAIHALKYRGERRLQEPLAQALAARWERTAAGGDVLTWVPVHPRRRRERGFDQAEELARSMGSLLEIPVLASLQRTRRTEAMHALGHEARVENISHAFTVSPEARERLPGHWPILVDDIITTGATLAGCARALSEAGAIAVSAIAVARDR